MHEPKKNCRTTPGASLSSDGTAGGRILAIGGGASIGSGAERRVSVEEGVCGGRGRSPRRQHPSGAHAQALAQRVQATTEVSEARPPQARLVDRVVDASPDRRTRRSQVRRGLRAVGRVASARATRLELPEAGATGARTGSGRHRPLAEARLATLKKTRGVTAGGSV